MDKKFLLIIIISVILVILFGLNIFSGKKKTTPKEEPSASPSITAPSPEGWHSEFVPYEGSLKFITVVKNNTIRGFDENKKAILEVDIQSGQFKILEESLPSEILGLVWDKNGEIAIGQSLSGNFVLDLKNRKLDVLPKEVSLAFPDAEGRYFVYLVDEPQKTRIYFGDTQERKRVYSNIIEKKVLEVVYSNFRAKTLYFLSATDEKGLSLGLYKWEDGTLNLIQENCSSAKYLPAPSKLLVISDTDQKVLAGGLSQLEPTNISANSLDFFAYFNSTLYFIENDTVVSEDGEVIFQGINTDSITGLFTTEEGLLLVTQERLIRLISPKLKSETLTPKATFSPKPIISPGVNVNNI